MTPEQRTLLAYRDKLRTRVKAGEVEAIAVVAITDDSLEPWICGEPQSTAALHGAGMALLAQIHSIIEANEDDDELPSMDARVETKAN